MNVSKLKTATDPNGGGVLLIKSNAAGTNPVIDLGYIADSDFKDTTAQKDLQEETGNTFLTIDEKRTVTLDVTLWQSDSNMINAIKEMRGGSYQVVWKKSAKLNQWIIMPECTIKPDFNFKTGDGKIKLTWNVSELSTNYSLTGASLTGSLTGGFGITGTTATTATVSANDYYVSIQ